MRVASATCPSQSLVPRTFREAHHLFRTMISHGCPSEQTQGATIAAKFRSSLPFRDEEEQIQSRHGLFVSLVSIMYRDDGSAGRPGTLSIWGPQANGRS